MARPCKTLLLFFIEIFSVIKRIYLTAVSHMRNVLQFHMFHEIHIYKSPKASPCLLPTAAFSVSAMTLYIIAASWENQQCGFQTGPTQTGLYKHRKELEA